MADRKAVMKPAPARPHLDELRERAKSVVVTEEMLNEQRISFAFGNAPAESGVTKDSVRSASHSIRMFA